MLGMVYHHQFKINYEMWQNAHSNCDTILRHEQKLFQPLKKNEVNNDEV